MRPSAWAMPPTPRAECRADSASGPDVFQSAVISSTGHSILVRSCAGSRHALPRRHLGCARLVRLAGVYLASSNLYARAATTGVASNLVPSTSSSSTNVWTRCRAAGRRSACAHEICTSGLSLAPRGWTLSGRCGSESLLARSSSLTSRTWHGDKTLSYGPARASSGVLCALRYDYARCGLVERAIATVRRPASVASPQPPPPPPLPVLAGADSAASMAATLPWSHTGSSHVS